MINHVEDLPTYRHFYGIHILINKPRTTFFCYEEQTKYILNPGHHNPVIDATLFYVSREDTFRSFCGSSIYNVYSYSYDATSYQE